MSDIAAKTTAETYAKQIDAGIRKGLARTPDLLREYDSAVQHYAEGVATFKKLFLLVHAISISKIISSTSISSAFSLILALHAVLHTTLFMFSIDDFFVIIFRNILRNIIGISHF